MSNHPLTIALKRLLLKNVSNFTKKGLTLLTKVPVLMGMITKVTLIRDRRPWIDFQMPTTVVDLYSGNIS